MRNQTGVSINVFRFFIEFHWYYLVGIMTAIDSLTVCCLVFLGYKFKLIQLFFGNMRDKMAKPGDTRMRENDFRNDFIVGIKLHEDALWCARNVQKTFGIFYNIQILETVTLLVMCLVKVAASAERHTVYLLANLAYIACLIVLTGSYMLPAGDISHEASILSTSIFHCGWELAACRKDLRVLAVIALQRSQVPVTMTAFGILTLSYTNLITVLRSSYSFFAVMY
uniref:Odorant Receptor 60 n=1 Tax=Dendrolimus punctatus TaxID=238572 RepID=A0A2K8GKX8_9NEOP|nr:Odorant Receptor 60 [Dendrolimus punctatus]